LELSYSFCVTCKNRSELLKQTIEYNLNILKESNIKYEYILINYDSEDDLHEFITFKKFNNNFNIKYIKIPNKPIFHYSKAKNLAHFIAVNSILINLDCDNYITKEFISFLQTNFSRNKNIITIGTMMVKGSIGRICISKENFNKLGGYNEKHNNYAFEDPDLIKRATHFLNLELIEIPAKFLKAINHKRIYNKNVFEINDKITNYYIENNIMNPNK